MCNIYFTLQLGESGLYVTDLKDHVIIHPDGNQIYHDGSVLSIPADGHLSNEQVQHLVMDGQVNIFRYNVNLQTLVWVKMLEYLQKILPLKVQSFIKKC